MVHLLSLEEQETVQEIWTLQHASYPYEAERIGLTELPPLMDTFESIASCGEIFYGFRSTEGDLIGAIAVELGEEQLTISRMMVHPQYFRQGIAAELITAVLDTYARIPLFIVSTGTKNAPAAALYEKYGFKRASTFEVAPGVELTEFHLRRHA
ncbi:GNAT family N-acetyltransferase [Paenibacillus lemnae]|uniref:GNAT family N-acetyltransferase n=1 Tax=Paenibacillus lemnae TaxID=1330551 RepID=A0A848MDG9_PAELE|nr:GNAT family N-acetyltransferase [Paenibacillus lemnae]NMO98241.1 GNAT family N-acetyltransferase [Paenibacillus lemnae]